METALGRRCGMTAPHRIAALVGVQAMEDGMSAVEAMVAAAATIAVVYPHMNGLGGDAFWTIKPAGAAPFCVMGCGRSAGLATQAWYAGHGITDSLPSRGPKAALTVPGAVGSWDLALTRMGSQRTLSEMLAPAIALARDGVATSRHQAGNAAAKLDELRDVPGFADQFLVDGAAPAPGALLQQPALAATLEQIAAHGTDSFYRGDIAATHAACLEAVGSPLRRADFHAYRPEVQASLTLTTRQGRLYNTAPPTQGMASLAILGVFDRLDVAEGEGFAHIHGMIEAIKQAYLVRNAELGDPDQMTGDAQALLAADRLDAMAAAIDPDRARPWPEVAHPGDTIWMGATDAAGNTVSFIQSLFFEFGSGVVCPETGVLFQNRGADFLLTDTGPRALGPGRMPFHTLNPALAELADGRVMAYGTQGGEGQPQTQAAIFSRYAQFGVPLQTAIQRPRWLLGKAWGAASTSLKLEADFDDGLIAALKAAGNEVEVVAPCNPLMGHAGAVVRHADGLVEAATDPRSDGAALAV